MTVLITLSIMAAIVLLFVGIFMLLGPDTGIEERLLNSRMVVGASQGDDKGAFRQRVNQQFESARIGSQLTLALTQAGIKMTAVEFLALNAALIIGAFGLGFLIGRTVYSGLGLAILALLGPRFWLKRQKEKRLADFQSQLPDVLNLLVGSLRSGYGLVQALQLVAQEMPSPSKEEYGRVTQEMSLGLSTAEALDRLLERMESPDLEMVVAAINVQSEVGGNLGSILDTIANTIRERIQIKGEIRTITGMQRMTGYMLAGMPFILGVILMLLNPRYMMQMFVFPWFFIPIGAAINIVVGLILISKMVNSIEV
ncbi:MAG: hypothetical protein D6694_12240 [Gammaproteobacteria bacterium]|nr:MAG: hypothetical protein D6694_12240 [Gammaproteobacteria bacterium]